MIRVAKYSLLPLALVMSLQALGQEEPELTGSLSADASYRGKFVAGKAGAVRSVMVSVGDGGTGPYKSVLVGDPSLTTHTIFRPKDLTPFGKNNLLPIVAWGNGGCSNGSGDWRNLLSEIASHGFLIVSIGPVSATMSLVASQGATTSSQLFDAIEWATAENARSGSPYYQKIDPTKIAVMGMSCGGKQALYVSPDARITTTIVWNSAAYPNDFQVPRPPGNDQPQGAPPSKAIPRDDKAAAPTAGGLPEIDFKKEDLQKIHAPILYVTGTKDFFYPVAKDGNPPFFNCCQKWKG